jgi:hypothetical protein
MSLAREKMPDRRFVRDACESALRASLSAPQPERQPPGHHPRSASHALQILTIGWTIGF